MASNKELVAQAVTAIPLWRAFLDKKEVEQDALLAEIRNEQPPKSKPQQLLENLTSRFQKPEPKAPPKEVFDSVAKEIAEEAFDSVAQETAGEVAQEVAKEAVEEVAQKVTLDKDNKKIADKSDFNDDDSDNSSESDDSDSSDSDDSDNSEDFDDDSDDPDSDEFQDIFS